MRIPRFLTILMTIVLPEMLISGEQSVIPQELQNNKDFYFASCFLRKYISLLNSPGSESVADTMRRIKDDGLKFLKGNDAKMRTLTGKEEFIITLRDNSYEARWMLNHKDIVVCTFPTNIGLLTFSNKVCLENKMIETLSHLSEVETTLPLPHKSKSELEKLRYSGFYILDKGYYVTPSLKHQIVYEEIDRNDCKMLYDPLKYPIETLSNVMLSGYYPVDVSVNVCIDQYGYNTKTLKVPFISFFKALSDEGSTPFWAVDKIENTRITGLYVWINRPGGYAHVIKMEVPINSLESSLVLEGRLNCYVRLDNLKSLFEEYPEI